LTLLIKIYMKFFEQSIKHLQLYKLNVLKNALDYDQNSPLPLNHDTVLQYATKLEQLDVAIKRLQLEGEELLVKQQQK
jgi:hypothetical protein